MDFSVAVRVPGVEVEASSAVRVPFESKGWPGLFSDQLKVACGTLVAAPHQVLHAIYTSAELGRADLENVLVYNPDEKGIARIGKAAAYGLLLERSFATAAAATHPHHYRYRLADRSRGWTHWRATEPLGSLRLTAAPAVFTAPNARRWWLEARRGEITAYRASAAVPGRFVLHITVSRAVGTTTGLTGLLKPLTDGLVAALHADDGSNTDAVLQRTAAIDPDLTVDEFRHLLAHPAEAPLGRVRLFNPWRTSLQINPADDRIVALDVRIDLEAPPGTVTARVSAAEPVTSSGL